jgi:gluconolactonase
MKYTATILLLFILTACNNSETTKSTEMKYKKVGEIERLDSSINAIISPGAQAEIIAEGLDWSEGPVWVESQKMLLFSDVPRDTIFKWTEEKGKEVYLTPSGYTDTIKRGGEMGSNGLILDKDGHLVLCQHGNRQMAKMDAALDKPAAKYIPLANNYNGKKFNSPNDAVYNSNGELFFTDPPYGLEKNMDDPKKEIPFQGVYRVTTSGQVLLVTSELTRPNGLAFFPDGRLLVANSDPDKPNWYLVDAHNDDTTVPTKIFYSAAGYDKSLKGLPDGMKIDKNGNVFATGPGGVWIFNSAGKLLGKIKFTDAPASNCAFSPDEKTLYITNDMNVVRIKLRD